MIMEMESELERWRGTSLLPEVLDPPSFDSIVQRNRERLDMDQNQDQDGHRPPANFISRKQTLKCSPERIVILESGRIVKETGRLPLWSELFEPGENNILLIDPKSRVLKIEFDAKMQRWSPQTAQNCKSLLLASIAAARIWHVVKFSLKMLLVYPLMYRDEATNEACMALLAMDSKFCNPKFCNVESERINDILVCLLLGIDVRLALQGSDSARINFLGLLLTSDGPAFFDYSERSIKAALQEVKHVELLNFFELKNWQKSFDATIKELSNIKGLYAILPSLVKRFRQMEKISEAATLSVFLFQLLKHMNADK